MTLGGSGLGTISAPVIGGLIYGFLETYGEKWAFFGAFIFYSALILLNVIVICTSLPNCVNNTGSAGGAYEQIERSVLTASHRSFAEGYMQKSLKHS